MATEKVRRSNDSPGRVGSKQFLLLLGSAFFVTTAVQLILPVLPLAVEHVTGSAGYGGIVTGAMSLLMVVFELLTPRLIRLYPTMLVLRAGLLLTAIAVAGFWLSNPLAVMVVLGATLGVGLGVAVTVTGALVAALAPFARRGEAVGYYGLATSIPAVFAPSTGLLLVAGHGLAEVFAVAAACVGCAAAAAFLMTHRPVNSHPAPTGYRAALRDRRLIWIVASFVLVAIAYGGIITFASRALPITGSGSAVAFLFISGIMRSVTRVATGPLIDRFSSRFITIPALILTGVGLVCLAAGGNGLVIAGAVLFGTGYAVVQNASFVAMLERVPEGGSDVASGLWNLSMDGGLGVGAIGLGPLAAAFGYRGMFWALPGVIAFSLLIQLMSWHGESGRGDSTE